ncbi:MAG TPA: hypothetical protein VGF32_00535 [Streptosporangiaceae bacterium]|jgi:hypothetical protein
MDEKYPDQGPEGHSQDLEAERGWPAAAPDGGEPRPAAEPALRTPTGDERVDAAVAGLSRLAGAPPDEHVAVLEEVHGRLRDILGEAGEGTS